MRVPNLTAFNGKPYWKLDDLGVSPISGNPQSLTCPEKRVGKPSCKHRTVTIASVSFWGLVPLLLVNLICLFAG